MKRWIISHDRLLPVALMVSQLTLGPRIDPIARRLYPGDKIHFASYTPPDLKRR